MRGIVKWFNSQKGYGFIATENGNDVFVHHSNINKEGFRYLTEEDIVSFDLGANKDGREQAINVTPILTIKMIESTLKKENLFLQSMKDTYGVKKYLVVDINNILQTSEQGMSLEELAEYAEMPVRKDDKSL